jgi:hypothetical protein
MTHINPFWWPDLVFHEIEAILFLVFAVLAAMLVAQSSARVHLQWLVPFVVNDTLVFAQSVAWNGSSLLHIHWNAAESALYHTAGYMAGIAGIYGMFMLWRTLRVVLPVRGQALAGAMNEGEIWPPPPAVSRPD